MICTSIPKLIGNRILPKYKVILFDDYIYFKIYIIIYIIIVYNYIKENNVFLIW